MGSIPLSNHVILNFSKSQYYKNSNFLKIIILQNENNNNILRDSENYKVLIKC